MVADRTPLPEYREPIGKPQPMDRFPAKYGHTMERNQKLNLCCRHMENMTAQVFKTNPRLPGPDLLVATCKCGRKHYRLQVGET